MSEQDRFDWSDDTDFESLSDEPIEGFADFESAEDFGSLDEDFPADGDADAFQVEESVDAESADTEPESSRKEPIPVGAQRGRGISGGELGFLFSASTLVAAAGIGSASLLAIGVNPAILWQPAELLQWQNYLNLQNHPLNILALICLGVVALTLLGSRAIAKAASGANKRASAAEDMLDRVTSLRLDSEGSWQDPVFKSFEPAATFVAETLGAWRLQAARQKKFTGLEGELHRLEKALSDNSRTDLAGRFDNPLAGTLADQMVRYLDEREAALAELKVLREKDKATAAELVQILQDARCWQESAEQTLGLQGATVERLADRLAAVSEDLPQEGTKSEAEAALADFKAEFDRIRVAATKAPSTNTELSDLVDKGSKLAFQIAMEVARLGPRGERLVPMSQSLEDLTTEFRAAADRSSAESSPGQQWADSLERLAGKLSRLAEVAGGGNNQMPQQVRQCGAAARQLAANFAEITRSHQPQAERLTHLGTGLAEFAGVGFDADDLTSGNPENPPAGVLNIEGPNPFEDMDQTRNDGGIHQPADVDPFAVTPPPSVVEAPKDPDFTSSVGDPQADVFGNNLQQDSVPSLEIESSFGVQQNPFSAEPADVGVEDEKVYDLEDFGVEPEVAVAGDIELPSAPEDEVFEMEDLGAVPLKDEETIYDLAEFGAVALDGPAVDEDEKIYDLQEFGAVKLA